MLRKSIETSIKQEAYLKTAEDAQRFIKDMKGVDLFPEKTARMKKLWVNVK